MGLRFLAGAGTFPLHQGVQTVAEYPTASYQMDVIGSIPGG